MSQSILPPSDQPPPSPVLATQNSQDQPLLAHTAHDASIPSEELPLDAQVTHHDSRPDAFRYRSIGLAEGLVTQAQRNLAVVAKPLALHMQSIANIETMVPRVSLPSIHVFEHREHTVAMKMVSEHSMLGTARAAALLAHQAPVSLQSVHTTADDLRGTLAALPSFLEPFQRRGEIVSSSVFGGIAQSLKSVLPSWGIITQPNLVFPALSVVNQFPSITPFFPDISWLPAVTDQMNTLLAALPHWPSLDLKRLKERIKQRLLAAFRAVGLCLAPSVSEDLMYQIADVIERSGKRSSITLLIWNYYARHNHAKLQQAVERWQDNPAYARRWRSIVLPAFRAHTRGDYGLSISALAPLVEGICSHVVKKNMLVPAKKPKKGLLGLGSTEDVIIRTLKTAGDEALLESDSSNVMHWVRVKSALGFVEDVFCKYLAFEDDYDLIHLGDRELHRHGLLHGIQINAMTALNSLRLFLLLDVIHDLLQAYSARGGII